MSGPTNETLATTLSAFASAIDYDRIPAETRDAAAWHIADSIGVSIAGASPGEASGQAARRLAAQWRTQDGATLLGLGVRCRPESSALVNGALGQALEMDDKHGSSLARPGSTVVPAALAVAETDDLAVKDMIAAVVAGYEIMIRLGFVAGERFLERGYHTSSLLGAFGAAATVGRLKRSTPAQITDALGIAGTMAAGIQEATRTGSTSKILHGGWGAHIGILATDLARAGITGPSSVFEGHYGFFRTHLLPVKGELDWATATAGLGTRWYTQETAYKPYPCCQLLHAFIEAAKQILTDLARDKVPVQKITAISCRLAEPGLTLVTEPKARKWAPSEPHEARFSLPFTVASALIFGDIGLDSFAAERLRNPEIKKLAALVTTGEDPESDYPLHCPALMEVVADGKTYHRRIPFHPGCPEAPLSQDDVIAKFARNTGWLLGDAAPRIGRALAAMAPAEPVRRVIGRLDAAEIDAGPGRRSA